MATSAAVTALRPTRAPTARGGDLLRRRIHAAASVDFLVPAALQAPGKSAHRQKASGLVGYRACPPLRLFVDVPVGVGGGEAACARGPHLRADVARARTDSAALESQSDTGSVRRDEPPPQAAEAGASRTPVPGRAVPVRPLGVGSRACAASESGSAARPPRRRNISLGSRTSPLCRTLPALPPTN